MVNVLRKWPYEDGVLDPDVQAVVIEGKMLAKVLNNVNRPGGCRCIPARYICVLHRCVNFQFEYTSRRTGLLRVFLPANTRGGGNVVEIKRTLEW